MHCRCAYTGSVPSGYMRGLCDFGVMSRTKRRLSLADTSRNDTQRSNTTYRRTSHGLNLVGDLQHRRAPSSPVVFVLSFLYFAEMKY